MFVENKLYIYIYIYIYCMSPDSEYITLISYATNLEINLCNFLAIWAVLSILLDTKSNDLQYVFTTGGQQLL